MHYYRRNIGDYYKKAGRLGILEHGVYTLLIDACYDREKFPSLDDAIEWCWASSEAEITAVKFVLNRFFILENGVYFQKRIADELTEYSALCLANAVNGKKGGRPKGKQKIKRPKSERVNLESERVNLESEIKRSESEINPKPLTTNHYPLTTKTIGQNRFAEFWIELPKKIGKKDCEKIWKKRKLDAIADKIINDIKNRKLHDQGWIDGFIPNPKTYLNGDRWDDEIQKKGVAKNGSEGRQLSGCEAIRESKRKGDEWLRSQGVDTGAQNADGDALEGDFEPIF